MVVREVMQANRVTRFLKTRTEEEIIYHIWVEEEEEDEDELKTSPRSDCL